jgi:lysylphosphatidylglycerol synthetase-like protein (DUF2156 family)
MQDFLKLIGVGCGVFGAIVLLALLKGGTPDRLGSIFVATLIFGLVIAVFGYHKMNQK